MRQALFPITTDRSWTDGPTRRSVGPLSASNHRASRPSAASRAVSVARYAAGFLAAFAALLALPAAGPGTDRGVVGQYHDRIPFYTCWGVA